MCGNDNLNAMRSAWPPNRGLQMEWLIPAFVFALAVSFWRLSWRTDDRVVAWARFVFAVLLAIVSVAISIGIAAQ